MSPFAKSFTNDLKKELAQQNASEEKFKPSKNLVDKYNIRFFNEGHFVPGIVMINSEFNRSDLKKLNITAGSRFGNKLVVHIPLQSFLQFLHVQGIEYFEMNPKSELK